MTSVGDSAPILDAAGIMALIPHRPPFLLVDRVLTIDAELVVGEKSVSSDDPWLEGHFPGRPVMPGVLIVEGLAQLGGVFVMVRQPPEGEGWTPNLIGVDKVRFRKPVHPGDELRYELRPIRQRLQSRLHLWRFSARALVGDDVVCEATIAAAFVREAEDAASGAPEGRERR